MNKTDDAMRIDLSWSGGLIVGAIPKDRVERAIQLSFDKYCSVFHTLRKDIEVSYDVTLSIEEE